MLLQRKECAEPEVRATESPGETQRISDEEGDGAAETGDSDTL